jgi:glycosyl hydrolase family 114
VSRLTRRLLGAAAATALAVAVTITASTLTRTSADAAVTLPPAHAKFDYQIGGAYTPPAGVQVVTRDRTAAPAAGLYNICYVNAFQVQPGEQGQWAADLLLRDAKGNLVIDEDWGEPLLDLRTADKRTRIAAKVNGWIDGCAAKGYRAIEPDNYDSYTRSNGLDFAVAEECGQYDECGDYIDAFGNNVIVIEYTDSGRRTACSQYGGTLSIVQRDVDVSVPGDPGYVRKTC